MALSVASSTLNTNGNTITVGIAGVSGSLSPASGITGFVVYATVGVTSSTLIITSVTSSGTNVTITVEGPVPSSATLIKLSYSPGNLTDSGSNTLGVTNNFTTTNSSTQSGVNTAIPNTNFGFNGVFNDTAGTPASRKFTNGGTAQVSTIDFVVNATDCLMLYAVNVTGAGKFTVSVDNGAYTNVSNADNGGYGYVSLFSGLSAANHTVSIKYVNNNTLLSKNNFITTFGGTSAFAQPLSGTPNAPAVWSVYGNAAFISKEFVGQGNTNAGWYEAEGGISTSSSSGGGYNWLYSGDSLRAWWVDSSIQFTGNFSTISIYAYNNGIILALSIDGVTQSPVTLPSTNQYGWTSIATGLDINNTHNYRLTVALFTTPTAICQTMTTGGTGITQSIPATRETWAYYGDSITYGYAIANSTVGFPYKVGRARDTATMNRGISGTTVLNNGQSNTQRITAGNASPTKVFILYGTNDMAQVGGAETIAQFQTAFFNMMNTLVIALPAAKFYIMGILPRIPTAPGPANINQPDIIGVGDPVTPNTSWNYAVQQAITTGGNGSGSTLTATQQARIIYLDTASWVLMQNNGGTSAYTDPNSNFADGLHPNTAGYVIITNKLLLAAADAKLQGTVNIQNTTTIRI